MMKLQEFLQSVQNGLGLDSLRDADEVVRVVVGALKAALPADRAAAIADALPEELSQGWDEVAPISEDISDRTEMELEFEETAPQREQVPTITQG